MIIEENFLGKVKEFGLNSYEAKIWTALLSRGIATAGELSDISNVPRSRAYDVLESLEKKGFIIMKLGKPIKYIAVTPEEVIQRVKKKVNQDADSQLNRLNELNGSNIMSELTQLHTQGIQKTDAFDLSGSLKGRDSIYTQISSLISNAKKEIILSTTSEGLARKSQALKKAFKKAADNGVKIRITAPIDKGAEKAVKELSKIAEVKHSDKPGRFCVVDGQEMIFMVADDKKVHESYDVGIWVKSPFFAQAMKDMFNVHWANIKK
jgi:sugar-specific transcriptional regulator TrmB